MKCMKVKDIMQKEVVFVSPKTSLSEIARLIFGHGINGIPVCKGRKVVGFVTERDILAKFYPTMQEYMEDPVHAGDFEGREEVISEILGLTADQIMSRNPTVIEPDTPLLRAQSMMFIKKVGRLPVVDAKGNIVGIIAKGDIFRALVGKNIPFEEEERFYDWQARHYDLLIDWTKRLPNELADLVKLFKKEKAKKILDLACGTGEHAIALAQKNFEVFGLEFSRIMGEIAERKRANLSKDVAEKVRFINGKYKDQIRKLTSDFDAAIFLGNVLPHVVLSDKDILKRVVTVLNPQKSLLVFQLVNFDKMMNIQKGFRSFVFRKSNLAYEQEHAFLTFYSKDRGKTVTLTHAIFDFDGTKWAFRGMKGTPVIRIGENEITEMLKKIGFSKVSFYGGRFDGSLFAEPFKPLESDWLNVIAKR